MLTLLFGRISQFGFAFLGAFWSYGVLPPLLLGGIRILVCLSGGVRSLRFASRVEFWSFLFDFQGGVLEFAFLASGGASWSLLLLTY